MKPSEKQVLDILRATTLASISHTDFALIEKAVEEVGILNLTGTAQKLVKSAVQKHGEHDQKTHGGWSDSSDDSEGEDSVEPKNYKGKRPKPRNPKDDSEGEFEDMNYDDPRWMDDMDILRPPKRK